MRKSLIRMRQCVVIADPVAGEACGADDASLGAMPTTLLP
jgi:hypothetical protein